ncbi:hypothetical protein ACLHDG_00830 [Sulfurovum sp. CS9]|uniref:hypothetical protein n=1 Tax=Sulfurovum sp. CS9 TaxID=3391146 RepID=UPI0039E787A0
MKKSRKNKRVDENLKNESRRSLMKKVFYDAPKLIVLGPLLANPKNARAEGSLPYPPDPPGPENQSSTWSQRE